MSGRMRVFACIASAMLLSCAARSQKPTPSQTRTELPLTNSFVKVLQFTIGPGVFSPMAPSKYEAELGVEQARVVIVLRAESTPKDPIGALDADHWILRDVHFEPDNVNRHHPRIRKGVDRSISVAILSAPSVAKFEKDATELDPKHNKVLFENERVRVVSVHFRPGESGPIVDKRPRVIILLDDMHAVVTLPDGHSEPRDGKAGTVYWGKAGAQATKNVGEKAFENIVVELKGK